LQLGLHCPLSRLWAWRVPSRFRRSDTCRRPSRSKQRSRQFDTCVKAGHHVSVEVMNHNAMILATLHHELATIHSTYSAHAKAYTVLSYSFASGETTSGEIARRITKNPADVARIQGIPGLILAPGAVLIQFGKQTVGAIGVGGSSGPVNDELCAKAGIEKIRDRLTP
jgi:uncharacterized protein GlcG (DUF336 family)